MNTYTPDSWIIVTITSPTDSIRKVLGEWKGGYLYGDEWRLSSGITEIHDRGDHYEIHNESGSIYTCYKGRERIGTLSAGILNNLHKQAEGLEGYSVTAGLMGEI